MTSYLRALVFRLFRVAGLCFVLSRAPLLLSVRVLPFQASFGLCSLSAKNRGWSPVTRRPHNLEVLPSCTQGVTPGYLRCRKRRGIKKLPTEQWGLPASPLKGGVQKAGWFELLMTSKGGMSRYWPAAGSTAQNLALHPTLSFKTWLASGCY